MTPRLALVTLLAEAPPVKAFVYLRPSDRFYSEFHEGYLLTVSEIPNGAKKPKTLWEINLGQIDTVVMKNIILKQF